MSVIPIDLFLVDYGNSAAFSNSFDFVKRHREQLIKMIRVDNFSLGSNDGQILGEHVFYLIFTNQNSLGRLFVLGCGAGSGYPGSGSADFAEMMDWLIDKEIDISYFSAHSYDEHLQLWGITSDQYGQNVPFSKGKHRQHGPSPWDYGDEFVKRADEIEPERYDRLGRNFRGSKQQLYSNTLEFLFEQLHTSDTLRYL